MLGHRSLTSDDLRGILRRRRRMLFIPMLVVPVLALAASYLIRPQYISQTLVLVEQQKVPDNYVKPILSEDIDERLSSMKEQILSRSSIQPIIDRFNLYPRLSPDDKVATARKNIDIKPIHSEIAHSSGLPGFFISFKASDPHIAQQVCGEITSLFVGENLRAREQSAQGTTSFLQSQLVDAKSNLDQQDAKLAEFQRKYIGQLPGEDATNMNMLTSVNTQLEAATQALSRMEQDKTYQESLLAQQMQEAGKPGVKAGPDSRQLQLQSLETQEVDLAQRYTADYPDLVDVRHKIADLRKDIDAKPTPAAIAAAQESPALQQLRASIKASDQGIIAKRAEQSRLQAQISSYQSRLESSPLVAQQYKQLTRDYQTAQSFYDDLLSKMNQSKMATDLEHRQQGEQFRVMDEPNLPDAPSFPKRWMFLIGGIVFGLFLGLTISAVFEYRDTAIRSERDIYAFLKLPTLAVIPQIGEPIESQLYSQQAPSTEKKSAFSFLRKKGETAIGTEARP